MRKAKFNASTYDPSKTAIDRKKMYSGNPMSLPTRHLLKSGVLKDRILDFGNGYGADTQELNKLGFKCKGYDRYLGLKEYSNKGVLLKSYDILMSHYVFNVIYDLKEHYETVKLIKDIDAERKFISVRTRRQFRPTWKYIPEMECYITSSNTVQRHYKVAELEKFFGNHRVIHHSRDLYIIELFDDNAGDKLFRAKRGKKLGKYIGGVGYIHRDYADDVIPDDILRMGRMKRIPKSYNILKWDEKNKKLEYVESPDFDTSLAPKVGRRIKLEEGKPLKEEPSKGQLYHKKFLFVGDDYKGFDVEEDKKMNILTENSGILLINDKKRIGNEKYWKKSWEKLETEKCIDIYYK